MFRLHGAIAAAILALFIGALVGSSAFAAETKPAAAFGTVDVEKAFDNYEKKQQLDQELVKFVDQLDQKLAMRRDNRLLTPAEFDQLAGLKAKEKPTADDTKKIEELIASSKQREQELQALQQKPDTTEAEKTRLKELTDQGNKNDQLLKDEIGKYQEEITNRQIELSRQIMQEVEAAVASVAKEKGLTLVFNKSAAGEPGLIIYSNVDITDEVLKKLNKK